MKRSLYLFIADILEYIELIENSTRGVSKKGFESDKDIIDATARRLEIIGEAVKNIPSSFRNNYPEVRWKGVAGFRDVLTHGYFRVDLNLVWRIIQEDLPALKEQIEKIKKELENKSVENGKKIPK